MGCKHQIKIKSIRFFCGRPGDFCLIQKRGHPILLVTKSDGECEECKTCSRFEKTDRVEEYTEEESDTKFGIWEFLVPPETFKYKKKEKADGR